MTHPPAKRGLRLASYNVRKAVGLDRKRDPGRILEVIAGLDADVVALQEADLRLGARPSAFDAEEIRARTGLVPLPVSEEGPSLGWHGNAVLVREGVRLLDAERLVLPGLEPRGAVLTHLETTQGGLYLVGTHLGLTRRFRRRQAEAIRDVLRARAGRQADGTGGGGAGDLAALEAAGMQAGIDASMAPGCALPAVVMGDFNEWRRIGGLGPLTRDFELISPGRSFHASRPVAALDRIALSPHLALTQAGVMQTPLARRASDHLPIWADVELR